jgi:hypothetical protein
MYRCFEYGLVLCYPNAISKFGTGVFSIMKL